MKKTISLLLVFVLVFSMCDLTAVAATNKIDNKSLHEQTRKRLSNPDTFLLDSHRIPSSLETEVSPYSNDPGVGAVDIDDILEEESDRILADNRRFKDFDTFKYAAITIINRKRAPCRRYS